MRSSALVLLLATLVGVYGNGFNSPTLFRSQQFGGVVGAQPTFTGTPAYATAYTNDEQGILQRMRNRFGNVIPEPELDAQLSANPRYHDARGATETITLRSGVLAVVAEEGANLAGNTNGLRMRVVQTSGAMIGQSKNGARRAVQAGDIFFSTGGGCRATNFGSNQAWEPLVVGGVGLNGRRTVSQYAYCNQGTVQLVEENCNNGVDDDMDGRTDSQDSNCAIERCGNQIDDDADGLMDAADFCL